MKQIRRMGAIGGAMLIACMVLILFFTILSDVVSECEFTWNTRAWIQTPLPQEYSNWETTCDRFTTNYTNAPDVRVSTVNMRFEVTPEIGEAYLRNFEVIADAENETDLFWANTDYQTINLLDPVNPDNHLQRQIKIDDANPDLWVIHLRVTAVE